MPDSQLQRAIGKIEGTLEAIQKDIEEIKRETGEHRKDSLTRIQALELAVGKVTIKIAGLIVAGTLIAERVVAYAWDRFSG